jgi:hypothetical protein
MARIESTLVVPLSVEDTFSFLNAAESHARFIPNMAVLKQTSEGAFGRMGTTAQGVLSYFGLIKIPVRYEIIQHEPSNKLAMKGSMGPVAFRDGYILGKHRDGTEIKFWLELEPTGWTKIFKPFASLIGKIHAFETLRNLKREIQPS